MGGIDDARRSAVGGETGGGGVMIWEEVKEIEEKLAEIKKSEAHMYAGEIMATLWVNYGPEGKCIPGLITGEETPIQQLLNVLEFYHKQTFSKEAPHK